MAEALRTVDAAAIKEVLRRTIYNSYDVDTSGRWYHPLIGAFVRLSFHACLSERCVGCINLADGANNNGLSRAVVALEHVYASFSSLMSRADLWALAGLTAIEVASAQAAAVRPGGKRRPRVPELPFRYGRVDCPLGPHTNATVTFPNPVMGTDELLSFFRRNFDLSPRESVAIMGVHTLGGIRAVGSTALMAQWADNPDRLDNNLFKDLLKRSFQWTSVPISVATDRPPLWVWAKHGSTKRFMLNADMALLKNFTFYNAFAGIAGCAYDTCPAAGTHTWVSQYAVNHNLWQQNFREAYRKIIERGYPRGYLRDLSPPLDG